MTESSTRGSLATTTHGALRASIGRVGFFTLAFGAIIGSGWIVVLGDWLRAAGPGGVVIGLLCGGLVMVAVGLCYGELAARFSAAGGEFLYVIQTLGRFPGFMMGWFLTLYAIAVCAFESVVLSWLLRVLIPGIAMPELYMVGKTPVTLDGILTGFAGTAVVGVLHVRGAMSAIRFQNIITFSFIAIMAILIICGLGFGSAIHWHPLFASNPPRSLGAGILWVFSTCAFFLNGWQSAVHAIEERREQVTVRTAVRFMASGILLAALFYCGIVLSAAAAMPWQSLIDLEMPAVKAFASLSAGGLLGSVIVGAAIISLFKTWSALAWIASRLLLAQARAGFLPDALATCDPATGSPRRAVLLVTALSLAGPLLGRGALLPIVNMVAICLALSIILCLLVLLRRRRVDASTPAYSVPGGTTTIVFSLLGVALMIAVSVVQPLLAAGLSIPLEWQLLFVWMLLGVGAWWLYGRRRSVSPP